MSASIRTQVSQLIEHAADVTRRSQELRAQFEALLKRMEEAVESHKSLIQNEHGDVGFSRTSSVS